MVKKVVVVAVATAVVLVAAAAVLLGVFLGIPKPAPPVPGSDSEFGFVLPASAASEVLVAENMQATYPDGSQRVVARSYGGNPWEIVPDVGQTPVNITCLANGTCAISTRGSYRIRTIVVPQQLANPSDMALVARLHQQATFGADIDELDRVVSVYAGDFGRWIKDQMALQPTLTRAYFRSRANPRRLITTAGTNVAGETQPCELNTRWQRYTFELRDRFKNIEVRSNEVANRFTLYVDGQLRGETTRWMGQNWPGTNLNITLPASFRLCGLSEGIGAPMRISNDTSTSCGVTSQSNPALLISTNPASLQAVADGQAVFAAVPALYTGSFVLKTRSVPCTNASDAAGNSFLRVGNTTYRFDRRLRFIGNTLENPAQVGQSSQNQCPLPVKSFLSKSNCVRRASCGRPLQFRSAPVPLNTTILRAWYTDPSRRYVYSIQNLRLEAPFDVSPCSSGISRWVRTAGACANPTSLDATTQATISTAISSSTDTNTLVRDISLSGVGCTPAPETIGAFITVSGSCWQHVHPDLYSVRDATRWTEIHDGNQQAMAGGKPNPIKKWAEINGVTYLNFPANHPMDRWFDRRQNLFVVGRLGDTVDFGDLPVELQTEQMAVRVGALVSLPAGTEGAEACGSPGEVANVPELGNQYFTYLVDNFTETQQNLDFPVNGNDDYTLVVNNVALKAVDQLRQRVAWNLANIFTVNPTDIEQDSFPDAATSYFDIFVRNAFGSYIDIMREVSYHPLMGYYLTYLRNQAYAVSNSYPDENYAREIMQLFSVGLWQLNDDGTQKKDAAGNPIATYTNDDIVDFARVWTGFDLRGFRRNVYDARYDVGTSNSVDPMWINPRWRDRLPKAKLDDGYLGDTYPLCDEMPSLMFLREGATYEFTGDVSFEGSVLDNSVNGNRRGRLTPTTQSELYKVLCAAREDGTCTFPLRVTLPTTLPCTGSQECGAVGRVRVIRMVDVVGNATRYYTFVRPPCVRLSFFDSGRLTRRASSRAQCADPATAVAAPVCCNTNPRSAVGNYTSEVLYAAEVVTYDVAESRCRARNWNMCSGGLTNNAAFQITSADEIFMWTNQTCTTQVQVYGSGQIGMYDPAAPLVSQFLPVRNSTNNVFRVRWANDAYPVATGGNCPAGCRVAPTVDGPSCICNFTVTTTTAFASTGDLAAVAGDGAVDALADRLFIGASRPGLYDAGTYRQCTDAACTNLKGVTVWLHSSDSGNALSTLTIFELPPFRVGRRPRYVFNRVSTVSVSGAFSFRNPPRFNPLLGELTDSGQEYHRDGLWTNQAEYEVEALLEHLFEHDSTAPFVAYRFIQQMVTSNPSPRYVTEVVKAFRTGRYGNEVFSGKYGDLAATVYAVLMDREARSPLLEVDPTFGMLRDPLLKTYHILRALKYKAYNGREINMNNMINRIGVQAFKAPSVFGFYLPEYQPPGPATNKGLVSPAAQIATAPNLIGFLNGATSLVDIGLTSCDSGFAVGSGFRTCNGQGAARSDGELTHRPSGSTPGEIVDELNILLSSGRLNSTSRETLIREYNWQLNVTRNATLAYRHVVKLFLAAPEFNSNGVNLLAGQNRGGSNEPPSAGRRLKAIIVVFQGGGADSYNMIVPHSNCPTKNMYDEYVLVRQGAAINQSALLPINVPTGTQPCNTFGVHPSMPRLRQLYNDGDAAFLANIGALVEPVTLAEYKLRSKRLPPSLFAHNVMQRSIQNLNPTVISSEGVLGRIMEVLSEDAVPAYKTSIFSLSGKVKMVQGAVPADMISPSSGVIRLRGLNTLRGGIGNLTSPVSNSAMAETYSDAISQSISKTEYLGQLLSSATLNTTFLNSGLNQQFNQVAKLIKSLRNSTDIERVAFFTDRGGFDTHATFDLSPMFGDIDSAVGRLADELKIQGVWDDVVIVSISDFARTLTSNGAGTDHAWGGNHFVVGGKINGGRILGSYPTTLTDDGPLSLGRGRLIPELPFEAVWQGVAEWFGVPANKISKILPNAANFPADKIFTQSELFQP
eukprot:TRINITY_DN275_c0_g1_i1.p1 TRINITY_DN275_c0_g1~~TRINITY_DN275_c0_g1_i1.p1  ORF type:complete len:1994 (-),score=503.35 TRINITY_DN275_c0_g1_i1:77-6058(-)